MNKFKSMFQQANTRKSANKQRNIALRVEGYDLSGTSPEEHFAYGQDLVTKKNVSVSLRASQGTLTSGYMRLELAQIANPQNTKIHVQAGGVIIFDSCYQVTEGKFIAEWANAAIHNPALKHESVSMAYCTIVMSAARLDPRNPQKPVYNTAFVRSALVSQAQSFANSQTGELVEFLTKTLSPKEGVGQYRPEAIVRYVDQSSEQADVFSIILTSLTEKQDDDDMSFNRVCPGNKTMAKILGEQSDATPVSYSAFQALLEDMKANADIPKESFAVEVIPVLRRNFGPEKRKELFGLVDKQTPQGVTQVNGRSQTGNLLFNRFHKNTGEQTTKLWFPCILSQMCTFDTDIVDGAQVRKPKDYIFIKDIHTTDIFPTGYEQHHLPTKNFSDRALAVERYSGNGSDEAVKAVNQEEQALATQNEVTSQQEHSVPPAKNTPSEPVKHAPQQQTSLVSTSSAGALSDDLSEELFDDLTELLAQQPA